VPDGFDTTVLESALAAVCTVADESGDPLGGLADALRETAADTVAAVTAWIDESPDDRGLTWTLLYVLDLAGVEGAVSLYAREATRSIDRPEGVCESVADLDELVAVQAGEALAHRVGAGEEGALEALTDVFNLQPSAAVRIATARAANEASPDLGDRLAELLGDEAAALSWEVVSAESLTAEAVETASEPIGAALERSLVAPPDDTLEA
jgi:hypothetical protein